jgi:protein-L-isoaspartate(D-aspartate) O-methyltransferase
LRRMAPRAYARQMLATLGVDNTVIEAAYAAAPRKAFLGHPSWRVSSPFGGYRTLAGADPVILYQDLVSAASTIAARRSTPKLIEALGPTPGGHIAHVGAGAGYYSAILAELVGPSGRVTAVEFDAALVERARQQ